MKKSIYAMSLLSALTVTACGGGSGGSNYAAEAAKPSTGVTPVNQETAVSGSAAVQSPAESEGPATNDVYETSSNAPIEIDVDAGVLSNDEVPDLQAAQVSVVSEPTDGTLVLDISGSFSYTPNHNFTGVDSFEYALLDEKGQESTAVVTLEVGEQEQVDSGFTPIVASPDTVTVYVSSSEGLDSNDGLTINTPVQTLDHAFSLVRDGHPDHVLLKRGDVWVDEDLSSAKSGRSKEEPAVIAFYGETGGRPKLKTSGYTMSLNTLYDVNFLGLEIEAYKLNPDDADFDGETSANIRMIGDYRNILFEDIKFRFVEFIIQGYDDKKPRDITIRRSMILDKYSPGTSYSRDSRPSGIYTDNSSGLVVEESLWDHNGWNAEVAGAGANMFNHNMYISDKNNDGNKITVRNNIVTRASALGIHGRPGGLYENNFFGRNAIGLQMGYFLGPELKKGTRAHALNNVVSEGLNMDRGVNSCSGDNLCTKAIWGIQVENLGNADVRVEGNIVSNRLFEHEGHVSAIRQDDQAKYSDNIAFRWDTEDQGLDQGYPDPTRTLADYYASIGGEPSFEAFIEAARNRELQVWDERFTADAINDYIREGFGR